MTMTSYFQFSIKSYKIGSKLKDVVYDCCAAYGS